MRRGLTLDDFGDTGAPGTRWIDALEPLNALRSSCIKRAMSITPGPSLLSLPRFNGIPWLVHGFGTRSWKLADFRRAARWNSYKLIVMDQVHSDIVHIVSTVPARKLRGDGLITALPGVFLTIKTADCLPVFIVDEKRRVVGAVHCGWRGTQQRILGKAVQELKVRFGSDPSSLLIGMGPCIGPACYEVGDDVRAEFAGGSFPADLFSPHPKNAGRFLLDLRKANRRQLIAAGINPGNIFSIDACTHCQPNLLSYRRDRSRAGRMYAFIGLNV